MPWCTPRRGWPTSNGSGTSSPRRSTPNWWSRSRTRTGVSWTRSPAAPPRSRPRCRSPSGPPAPCSPRPSRCGIDCLGWRSACGTGWSPTITFGPSSPAPTSSTGSATPPSSTPTSPPHFANAGRGRRRGWRPWSTRWSTAAIPTPSVNAARRRCGIGSSPSRTSATGWPRRRTPGRRRTSPSSPRRCGGWRGRCARRTPDRRPRGPPMRTMRWSPGPNSAATVTARSPTAATRGSMWRSSRRLRRGS